MHYVHLTATELNGIEKKIGSDWNLETVTRKRQKTNSISVYKEKKMGYSKQNWLYYEKDHKKTILYYI